ncbi:MAG: hypothetical protein PHP74_01740 [Candidatus Gracilibacteria bacterium]|nr:hypothetical protein [Candidatus Gracilibacteria bacterium]
MALTDIIEKINKEAEKKIAQMEHDFELKKKELEKKYEGKKKEIDSDMETRIVEKRKKILGKAERLGEMEAKNSLLVAKRKLIAETIEKAIEELSRAKNLEDILAGMFKKIDLKDEGIVIFPAKGFEEITKKAMKNADKKFELSDKSVQIKGGFILKTDKVEIDNSFETIIGKQLVENLEIEINKLLF